VSRLERRLGDLRGTMLALFGRGFARVREPGRSPRSPLVVSAASKDGGSHDLWIENVPRR